MEIEGNRLWENVLPEDYLELSDGSIVENLSELIDALEGMDKSDFVLHVYGNHNDFAEWILEAYWDENLAGNILGVRDKKKIIRILKKALVEAEKNRVSKIVLPAKKGILKDIGGMYE